MSRLDDLGMKWLKSCESAKDVRDRIVVSKHAAGRDQCIFQEREEAFDK